MTERNQVGKYTEALREISETIRTGTIAEFTINGETYRITMREVMAAGGAVAVLAVLFGVAPQVIEAQDAPILVDDEPEATPSPEGQGIVEVEDEETPERTLVAQVNTPNAPDVAVAATSNPTVTPTPTPDNPTATPLPETQVAMVPDNAPADNLVSASTMRTRFPAEFTTRSLRTGESNTVRINWDRLAEFRVNGQEVQFGYYPPQNPPPFAEEVFGYQTNINGQQAEVGFIVGVLSDVRGSDTHRMLTVSMPNEATGEWQDFNIRFTGDQGQRSLVMINGEGELVGVPADAEMPYSFDSQGGGSNTNFVTSLENNTVSFPTTLGRRTIEAGDPIVVRFVLNTEISNAAREWVQPADWLPLVLSGDMEGLNALLNEDPTRPPRTITLYTEWLVVPENATSTTR